MPLPAPLPGRAGGAVGAGSGPRPPLSRRRRGVVEVGLALLTAGVIVLAFVLYQFFGTTLAERHSQSKLAEEFHAALPAASASSSKGSAATDPAIDPGGAGGDPSTVSSGSTVPNLSPSAPTGTAIDHLVIPAIGVDKYVVEGTGEGDLAQGPGHYVGTPLPGQPGNAVIAGHRTTYGAPFYRLNELTAGDQIYVTNTAGKTFVYRVVRQLLAEPSGPSATAVLADTGRAELTLTTCNPRFEAINRLVVVADLVTTPKAARTHPTSTTTSPAATTPTSGPAAPAAASARAATGGLGGSTDGAWWPSVDYGALVVALWVATRLAAHRARRRWRGAATLVVGIAVCAVPLWFCFENVVRILPPSI
jgi:sortase A